MTDNEFNTKLENERKNIDKNWKYWFVSMVLLMIVGSLLVPGCQGPTEPAVSNTPNYGGMTYVVIDGMPCLHVFTDYRSGITCDWSQWNGTVDGDTIVLP